MKSELYLKNISLLGHSQSKRPFKFFGEVLKKDPISHSTPYTSFL